MHQRRRRRNVHRERDPVAALRFELGQKLLPPFDEVDGFEQRRRRLCEAENVERDALAALDRAADVTPAFRRHLRGRLVTFEQLGERLHAHEDVVEFVRDRRRKLAEAEEAIRLFELLVDEVTFGDVTRIHDYGIDSIGVHEGPCRNFE